MKFIAGPLTGLATGMTIWETCIFTVLGMMTSVVIFSYFGKIIREKILKRFFLNKKKFTKKNRQFISIWNKYGLFGISFLTPVIFSPIGGTILLAALGGVSKKKKLFAYMLLSACFWSVVLTTLVHQVRFLNLY